MSRRAIPLRSGVMLLAVLLAGGWLAARVSADEDDPFLPGYKEPEPPVDDGTAWGRRDKLAILLEDDRVTFGPPGCPLVVVGRDVWHIETNRLMLELQGTYPSHPMTALSKEGRWFAAMEGGRSGSDDEPVMVWSTASGEQVLEIPGEPDRHVEFMRFVRDKYLLLGGRDSHEIHVWNVEAGKKARVIATLGDHVRRQEIAFTADGKLYAQVADHKLIVVRTSTGKTEAVMSPSPKLGRIDAMFNSIQALAFSANGKELAAVSSNDAMRLMCWNRAGEPLVDQPLKRLPRFYPAGYSLDWLPDGNGWLINGNLVDRESMRIVVSIRNRWPLPLSCHVLDRHRLFGGVLHQPSELELFVVPWDEIRASLKQVDEGVGTLLDREQPVLVTVETPDGGGDQTQSVSRLRVALTQRLAADGIRVEAGQPTVFRLTLHEEVDDRTTLLVRASPNASFRRKRAKARGLAVIELLADGDGEPVWRQTFQATSARHGHGSVSVAVARERVLETLESRITKWSEIPYFYPKSPDQLPLPLIVE